MVASNPEKTVSRVLTLLCRSEGEAREQHVQKLLALRESWTDIHVALAQVLKVIPGEPDDGALDAARLDECGLMLPYLELEECRLTAEECLKLILDPKWRKKAGKVFARLAHLPASDRAGLSGVIIDELLKHIRSGEYVLAYKLIDEVGRKTRVPLDAGQIEALILKISSQATVGKSSGTRLRTLAWATLAWFTEDTNMAVLDKTFEKLADAPEMSFSARSFLRLVLSQKVQQPSNAAEIDSPKLKLMKSAVGAGGLQGVRVVSHDESLREMDLSLLCGLLSDRSMSDQIQRDVQSVERVRAHLTRLLARSSAADSLGMLVSFPELFTWCDFEYVRSKLRLDGLEVIRRLVDEQVKVMISSQVKQAEDDRQATMERHRVELQLHATRAERLEHELAEERGLVSDLQSKLRQAMSGTADVHAGQIRAGQLGVIRSYIKALNSAKLAAAGSQEIHDLVAVHWGALREFGVTVSDEVGSRVSFDPIRHDGGELQIGTECVVVTPCFSLVDQSSTVLVKALVAPV